MVDEIDKANEQVEHHMTEALKKINTIIPKNKTGKCIWCGTEVEDERRWCSAICRDDQKNYEKK